MPKESQERGALMVCTANDNAKGLDGIITRDFSIGLSSLDNREDEGWGGGGYGTEREFENKRLRSMKS